MALLINLLHYTSLVKTLWKIFSKLESVRDRVNIRCFFLSLQYAAELTISNLPLSFLLEQRFAHVPLTVRNPATKQLTVAGLGCFGPMK